MYYVAAEVFLTAMHNPDAETHNTYKLPAQVLQIINVFHCATAQVLLSKWVMLYTWDAYYAYSEYFYFL